MLAKGGFELGSADGRVFISQSVTENCILHVRLCRELDTLIHTRRCGSMTDGKETIFSGRGRLLWCGDRPSWVEGGWVLHCSFYWNSFRALFLEEPYK